MKILFITIGFCVYFVMSSFGYSVSNQVVEFFGYEINGKFNKSHKNSLGIKKEFMREKYKEQNLEILNVKPLSDFNGLKSHSTYALVWKDSFLIKLDTNYAKTINNEIVPFNEIEECYIHLKNLEEYIIKKYDFKFNLWDGKYFLRFLGNSITEGYLHCRETYFWEDYKSEGYILSVNFLGSKFRQMDFEYKQAKEKERTEKISPFGIEFGTINQKNFKKLTLKSSDEYKRFTSYFVHNPKFPLTFFKDGSYFINTVDEDIWQINAQSNFFDKSQLDNNLNKFEKILNKLFENYDYFHVEGGKYDKGTFSVKDFSTFKKMLKELNNEQPLFRLWNLVLDNSYRINILCIQINEKIMIKLSYTNKFYESKYKLEKQIITDMKDNLEEAL